MVGCKPPGGIVSNLQPDLNGPIGWRCADGEDWQPLLRPDFLQGLWPARAGNLPGLAAQMSGDLMALFHICNPTSMTQLDGGVQMERTGSRCCARTSCRVSGSSWKLPGPRLASRPLLLSLPAAWCCSTTGRPPSRLTTTPPIQACLSQQQSLGVLCVMQVLKAELLLRAAGQAGK